MIKAWPYIAVAIALLFAQPLACIAQQASATAVEEPDVPDAIASIIDASCLDCHFGDSAEAGLDLAGMSFDLTQQASFQAWQNIFDRVTKREMPPEDFGQLDERQYETFQETLRPFLVDAHQRVKGTVLRRLNRREYQNTLNDLFGTNLDLENLLPEDGRSHEFDNVGDALGLSMVHLERYLEAADLVLDTSIADSTEPPTVNLIEASYAETQEGEQFIGKRWKLLDDGAVVRFSGGGYPTGMIRGTRIREAGYYLVKVTGYAYQSDTPITCSIGGTSFARGSQKPIYQFAQFPPGEPTTFEFRAWIEPNYMIAIEPYGIQDPQRYQRQSIADYEGPGLAILHVSLEGPLVDSFPSRGHELIFEGIDRREIPPRNPNDRNRRSYQPQFEVVTNNEVADAQQSILRVSEAAFRRPVEPREVDRYVQLFQRERESGKDFESALRTSIAAVLCSPKFLFLRENDQTLDDYQLAARLSYFLTRTAPDAILLDAAQQGQLVSNPDALRAQTERLMNDARFDRFIEDFCDAWLNLRELDFTAPDPTLFPEYDDYLRYSMPRESYAYLNELIHSNRTIQHLISSDMAMLNDRLAHHYGIDGIDHVDLRLVELPENSLRGGLMSQAAVLKVTANGTNTSPVVRGAWFMERLLGQSPAPPPPGILGVEPDIRGATTLRELLALHRDNESCNACHRQIDPPGFALESFDPIGGFRERYRSLGEGERVSLTVNGRSVRYKLGPPVDSSGEFSDGTSFDGFNEFRAHLANQPRVLARSFATKLLTFATGRELGFSDRDEIDRIIAQSELDSFQLRDLIHTVVQSEIFRNK